jgi:hypothetical protein
MSRNSAKTADSRQASGAARILECGGLTPLSFFGRHLDTWKQKKESGVKPPHFRIAGGTPMGQRALM